MQEGPGATIRGFGVFVHAMRAERSAPGGSHWLGRTERTLNPKRTGVARSVCIAKNKALRDERSGVEECPGAG